MQTMYKEGGYHIYPVAAFMRHEQKWRAVTIVTLPRLEQDGLPTLTHTRSFSSGDELFATEQEARESALQHGRTLIASNHPDLPR